MLQRTLHIRKCQFLTSFYSFVKQAKSVVDVSVNLDINWLGQIAYEIYFGFSDEQEVHSKSSYKTLRKKCPYSEFFWSAFSRIWTEYEKVFRISPDSVQLRKKVDQKTPNTNTFHAMKGKLNLLYTSWFRGLEKSGMAWIRNRKLSFDKNIFSGIKTSNLRSPDSWPRSLKIIISLNI